MVPQEELQAYINSVKASIAEKNSEGLNDAERRIGKKIFESEEAAAKIRQDMGRTENMIHQARDRLSGLDRKHLEELSRAAALMESLLTLKFGDELGEKKEEQEKRVKGNGSQDPSEALQAVG